MNKFYLHNAIPYVNASPHLGHAQEFVISDAIKRYQKLKGLDVLSLCGADENALKIVQAAQKAHQDPQTFTDIHNQNFLDLIKKLNAHFDVWQRGSDRVHHFPASQKLWQLCSQNGDIYKKTYTGLYCVGCEAFYTIDELDENGECFEHPGKKLEKVSEENYFFRLSRYQEFLEQLIQNDKLKIIPQIRKNEALSFIKKGLADFSISRSRERAKNWGVPVPNDDNQIMYVWFDALNIYQSGIGFSWDEKNYQKWWPPQVMVIGKGILRFHAVYWPAILQSAKLKLPKELFVHGYITSNGQKMSKTLGNVVDPNEIIDKYGTDPVRYYLLREIPSYGDGDFSENRFKELYNADLANGLGNLIARVAKLCEKVTLSQNVILASEARPESDVTTLRHSRPVSRYEVNSGGNPSFSESYKSLIDQYRFSEVLEHIWEDIKKLDQFINSEEPWRIKDEKKLTEVLQKSVTEIISIAKNLKPFLPDTAKKILHQFSGEKIKSAPPLFPRIT